MEAALDSLQSFSDPSKANLALNLIQVYLNNIAKDPINPKFRKIRIANAKFNSTIWDLEQARTFLFLCGFEQQGEFLVLPETATHALEAAKLLIDGVLSSNALQQRNRGSNISKVPQQLTGQGQASQEEHQKSVLKLASPKGGSFFDEGVKADLTLMSYMVEMGYDKGTAEKALIATKNTGVQTAMDWISLNPHAITQEATAAAEQLPRTDVSSSSHHVYDHESSGTGVTTSPTARPVPISRYQKTADERHKFQEKLRLEAIEAARVEKHAKLQHKEFLLKEMQGDKQIKKEKAEQAKKLKTAAQTSEGSCTTESRENTQQSSAILTDITELRIRLPNGQVSELRLQNDAHIQEIYRSTEMNESEFAVMTSYPQVELTDKMTTLESAGLAPRAALVVQRRDQQGMVTEGYDQVCMVKNIQNIEEWQSILGKATDKLLVAEFYAAWCSSCRAVVDKYESLNAKYGINQEILFVRVDVDQLRVLKYQLRVSSLPTFKLFWNEREVAEHQGTDTEALEELIRRKREKPTEEETMEEAVDDPR